MRLWHQSLLPYLDNQRLLGQHRECCALRGKGWGRKHKTVDYVFQHNPMFLIVYHWKVMDEMNKRGFSCDSAWDDPFWRGDKLGKDLHFTHWGKTVEFYILCAGKEIIFPEHTPEYLSECIDLLKAKGAKCDWDGIDKLMKGIE